MARPNKPRTERVRSFADRMLLAILGAVELRRVIGRLCDRPETG